MADKDGSCCIDTSKSYSPEESLGLILDCRLSKADYNTIRQGAKELYPSYHHILAAKEDCIPDSGIVAADYEASVDLQSLCDHTTKRILKTCQLKDIPPNSILEITHKVGFDGSTGQSIYKQDSEGERRPQAVEESLFLSCLVPLQVIIKETEEIIWTNPKPSSTQYCRPVRFQYAKESKELVVKEFEYFKNCELTQTVCEGLSVVHKLELTMVDGKVVNFLSPITDSCQVCAICGLSPKNMNNLELAAEKTTNPIILDLGLNTLHAWIRCLECLLNVRYKKAISKWQARGDEAKALVAGKKEEVRQKLKTALGITVDVPKSGGSGTSNDGNTARTFFRNYEVSAEVLGLDTNLVKNLYVILCTVSSKHQINPDAFQSFCMQTAKLFVLLYPWFPMPQSVHKILIHGHQVIREKPIPIGLLSEEAQESRNKDVKNFREHYTRKFSRKLTNVDVMRRLLCSSDPYITSLRRSIRVKNEMQLPEECLPLLA